MDKEQRYRYFPGHAPPPGSKLVAITSSIGRDWDVEACPRLLVGFRWVRSNDSVRPYAGSPRAKADPSFHPPSCFRCAPWISFDFAGERGMKVMRTDEIGCVVRASVFFQWFGCLEGPPSLAVCVKAGCTTPAEHIMTTRCHPLIWP